MLNVTHTHTHTHARTHACTQAHTHTHTHTHTFSDSSTGDSLLMFETGFLQRYQHAGNVAPPFVHVRVGPLSQFLQFCVRLYQSETVTDQSVEVVTMPVFALRSPDWQTALESSCSFPTVGILYRARLLQLTCSGVGGRLRGGSYKF